MRKKNITRVIIKIVILYYKLKSQKNAKKWCQRPLFRAQTRMVERFCLTPLLTPLFFRPTPKMVSQLTQTTVNT